MYFIENQENILSLQHKMALILTNMDKSKESA